MNGSKTNDDTINTKSSDVAAFHFDRDTKKLTVLDQLLLPQSIEYVAVPDAEQGHHVIGSMMVRGAPCIAAVGCLSIIAEMNAPGFALGHDTAANFINWLVSKSRFIDSARPTAVNLRNATSKLVERARRLASEKPASTGADLIEALTSFCLTALEDGQTLNRRLGDYGANEVMSRLGGGGGGESCAVLTHCNTGSLATVGYGTALGVIRSLHKMQALSRAYCTETRPYNQGSRLTAWELVREDIPATLIADSMVAYLMATRKIGAVLVGADCVAANGDTANKIGTLQLAVAARHYGVLFYVAAPTQSIDLTIKSGRESIKIEERPASELRCLSGVVLAPEQVHVWNPCFDVTPADLITGGIITEFGVCPASEVEQFVLRSRAADKHDLVALF